MIGVVDITVYVVSIISSKGFYKKYECLITPQLA
jgi:hypothetical protein